MLRRVTIIVYVLAALAVVIGWGNVDRFATRFAENDAATFGNRRGVWADTWHIAQRFPITGTGLNTYGISMLFFQTVEMNKHFDQAHSDYLQLLAEGGALVSIPAILVAVVLAWKMRREFQRATTDANDRWIRLGAMTGLGAIALQEIGDFSLQMPGNAALFVVLLALAIRPSPRRGACL